MFVPHPAFERYNSLPGCLKCHNTRLAPFACVGEWLSQKARQQKQHNAQAQPNMALSSRKQTSRNGPKKHWVRAPYSQRSVLLLRTMPHPVFRLILSYLDPIQLAEAACVSKHWHEAASDDLLWFWLVRDCIARVDGYKAHYLYVLAPPATSQAEETANRRKWAEKKKRRFDDGVGATHEEAEKKGGRMAQDGEQMAGRKPAAECCMNDYVLPPELPSWRFIAASLVVSYTNLVPGDRLARMLGGNPPRYHRVFSSLQERPRLPAGVQPMPELLDTMRVCFECVQEYRDRKPANMWRRCLAEARCAKAMVQLSYDDSLCVDLDEVWDSSKIVSELFSEIHM